MVVLCFYYKLNSQLKYFTVSDFTSLIQFERPFLTRRIRLRPVEWFDSEGDAFPTQFVCLGVDIYGCLQSQGEQTLINIVQHMCKSVYVFYSPVRELVTIGDSTEAKVLSISLPVTLITIAGLAVLVVVLIYLLVRIKKQSTKKNGRHRADSGYSKLDRTLQQPMSPSLSDEHSFMAVSTSSEQPRPSSETGPRYAQSC